MSLQITKDLLFDKFGDFSFAYGDLIYLTDKKDIFYQNTIHRLQSRFNDYKNYPSFAADLASSIGKPVSTALDQTIQSRIKWVLTMDGFLTNAEISIASYVQSDTIFYRLTLLVDLGTNSIAYERIIINTIFNTSSGLLYANNNTNTAAV